MGAVKACMCFSATSGAKLLPEPGRVTGQRLRKAENEEQKN
jgi:hypothetical protein